MSRARHISRSNLPGLIPCLLLSCVALTIEATPPKTGPATPDEIAVLIRDLSDPSFGVRRSVTRRLCAIGMPAVAALEVAATGTDFEAAQRARRVLDVLDDVYFAGVEITLTLSRETIGWNEPLDLTITCRNKSKYPAVLPFEINEEQRSAATSDARQVGDLLDAAEWLRVAHEGEGEIALRTDDISMEAAVREAVDRRVTAGPRSVLPPGETVVIKLTAFNRGWARFPLLDRGTYTLRFEYVPDWTDPSLAAARVGHASAREVRVVVNPGAPRAVSRVGIEANFSLAEVGGAFVATLTNRSDLPTVINANLGMVEPFALAEWIVQWESRSRTIPFTDGPIASWERFAADRLITVAPGESIELGRIDRKTVLERLRADAPAGESIEGAVLIARYRNPCGRLWQRRHKPTLLGNAEVPELFRSPLPRRLLTTPISTNRIPITPKP